jgi:hypothetical protein
MFPAFPLEDDDYTSRIVVAAQNQSAGGTRFFASLHGFTVNLDVIGAPRRIDCLETHLVNHENLLRLPAKPKMNGPN